LINPRRELIDDDELLLISIPTDTVRWISMTGTNPRGTSGIFNDNDDGVRFCFCCCRCSCCCCIYWCWRSWCCCITLLLLLSIPFVGDLLIAARLVSSPLRPLLIPQLTFASLTITVGGDRARGFVVLPLFITVDGDICSCRWIILLELLFALAIAAIASAFKLVVSGLSLLVLVSMFVPIAVVLDGVSFLIRFTWVPISKVVVAVSFFPKRSRFFLFFFLPTSLVSFIVGLTVICVLSEVTLSGVPWSLSMISIVFAAGTFLLREW